MATGRLGALLHRARQPADGHARFQAERSRVSDWSARTALRGPHRWWPRAESSETTIRGWFRRPELPPEQPDRGIRHGANHADPELGAATGEVDRDQSPLRQRIGDDTGGE